MNSIVNKTLSRSKVRWRHMSLSYLFAKVFNFLYLHNFPQGILLEVDKSSSPCLSIQSLVFLKLAGSFSNVQTFFCHSIVSELSGKFGKLVYLPICLLIEIMAIMSYQISKYFLTSLSSWIY